MSRWFRLYDDLVDDPKVQQLPAATFRGLINLWCLASKNDGALPSLSVVAFKLRMTEAKADALLRELGAAGLIDNEDGTLRPHNWNGRQFKSDDVSERVKKHRMKQRAGVSETLHGTPPETDTETDKQRSSNGLRAREDYDNLESLCRQAAGLGASISPSLTNLSPILTLLGKGYSLETDILPVLKARANPKARAWSYFVPAIEEQFAANKGIKPAPPVVPPPAERAVFIAVGTPEWDAWQSVKRTRSYRSDEHKADGWNFPSRWPPGHEAHAA